MDKENLAFVDDLNCAKDFWNIKVRIIRRWLQSYRLDLIFIGEKGKKIQACVKDRLIPHFDKYLQEDAVLLIKMCGVAEQKDRFPVIDLEKKINFYRCTEVSDAVGFRGHPYGLCFKKFSEIDEKLCKEVRTVDVIGHVVSCGNMDIFKSTSGKESKRMNFDLQDLQGNVLRCTVWDGYDVQFNTFISNHTSNQHVITIIQHGKIKIWRDALTVQNDMFGTRVFINEDIEEINNFRRSLILNQAGTSTSQSQLSSQTNYPVRTEFIVNTERKHVDEIRETDEEGNFVVVGTIRMLEEDCGWFYAGCRMCTWKVLTKTEYLATVERLFEELEKAVADSLWCPRCKCQATSVIPKFRVQFRVQDDTGSVSFLMFDKDVTRLLGVSDADIRERQVKSGDTGSFPHELDLLVNKLLAFKIVVTTYNLRRSYHAYTVQKLCDDPAIIAEIIAQDSVNQVTDELENNEVNCVKLEDSSPCGVDSKDVVSVTGSSLATDLDKDSETSPIGKRPIQSLAAEIALEGDCSATKRVRKKLQPYDV